MISTKLCSYQPGRAAVHLWIPALGRQRTARQMSVSLMPAWHTERVQGSQGCLRKEKKRTYDTLCWSVCTWSPKLAMDLLLVEVR